MPAEYEVKILEIDPERVAALILSKGGLQVSSATLQRRCVYDITPGDQSKWIRVRDNGRAVTLAVKEIAHDGIDGTNEVEVTVDDFAVANELLGMLGFSSKAYQENRRTSFTLDGGRLEIDEWPMLTPYLEIEADTPEDVKRIADLLGFEESQMTSENTTKVYANSGIDLAGIAQLRFS
ncbi:class IV adenylate cyclase [Rhodococcus sp. GOMB7]|uniref:class IV adenylate cyclase n=1 Tax=Rhodococcus sp. GOMB7 TaxID=2839033 RepID=UPI001C002614|nr:class IV adenylate cyclase [Rhodococcus sp. GOMB7]MBT9298995.1 class IV adenylate cyclase [Rhodococcus sp. GOMB7]